MVIAPEMGNAVTPLIAGGAQEGREAFARAYASRGANVVDGVIGLGAPQPQQAV